MQPTERRRGLVQPRGNIVTIVYFTDVQCVFNTAAAHNPIVRGEDSDICGPPDGHPPTYYIIYLMARASSTTTIQSTHLQARSEHL